MLWCLIGVIPMMVNVPVGAGIAADMSASQIAGAIEVLAGLTAASLGKVDTPVDSRWKRWGPCAICIWLGVVFWPMLVLLWLGNSDQVVQPWRLISGWAGILLGCVGIYVALSAMRSFKNRENGDAK